MAKPNFCSECGERLTKEGWRERFRGTLCNNCARRLGRGPWRNLVLGFLLMVSAFAFGRLLRPAPPPLIIQRRANSPLSDSPVEFDDPKSSTGAANLLNRSNAVTEEEIYICGARTQKGTPCHRRVHAAGERCFQHKGLPALLPPDKLVIKSK